VFACEEIMFLAEMAFRKAVKESVAAHLVDFGFRLRKNNNRTYVAESPHCRLTIVLDVKSIKLTVKPVSPDPEVDYPAYRLGVVLRAIAPEWEPGGKWWFASRDEIKGEVEKRLIWLADYGRNILQGDFTELTKVMDMASQVRSKEVAPAAAPVGKRAG